MVTAYLTTENVADFELLKSYVQSHDLKIKFSDTLDLEDKVFGNLMLEEETKETISITDFMELVDSEH